MKREPLIFYRNLKGYKYILSENYVIRIKPISDKDIFEPDNKNPFIKLSARGVLTIFKDYAWDGPSGPTIDTKSFMRGSLVHDALYQLMRQGKLPQSARKYADKLLAEICRADGMSRIRAWYVEKGVNIFGGSSAKITDKKEFKINSAP